MGDMPHDRSHLLWEGDMENGSATPLFLKSMDGWINSMIFDEQGGGSGPKNIIKGKIISKDEGVLCGKPIVNRLLEIHFSGNIDPKVIDSIKSYEYLGDKLHLLGFLNHKDVIKAYSKTSLLLLLLFNSESGKGNYPGKLFEYLATKLPILAFGPVSYTHLTLPTKA